MKYKILFLSLVIAGSARAVNEEPRTPQSYVLSFAEKVLPPDAKVRSVGLEVDQAEAVHVRSIPRGWVATVVSPLRAKFEVAIGLFSWGKDQGPLAPLVELDDRFWIVAILDEQAKPMLPRIRVTVHYVLPLKAELQSMEVSSSSIRLTYIP